MATKAHHFETRQHMRSGTFEIFHYQDAYLKEVALHHHDFYEIYFFYSGNVQYIIESRSYNLAPGDILLISPMELHQPMFHTRQRDYERIVLWINRRFLEGLCTQEADLTACFDTSAPGHTNLLRPGNSFRQQLSSQLERLMWEVESGQAYSNLGAVTYLVQILIGLNRLAAQPHPVTQSRVVSDSTVQAVLTYINTHYNEDLSLDYLSNRFFISKYHLSREFGRLVGTSVHRYLTQKRLAMAKQMMSAGMASTEVYQHCGFGDYSNFYRAFKSEYQISPKEFQARLKEPAVDSPLNHSVREPAEP